MHQTNYHKGRKTKNANLNLSQNRNAPKKNDSKKAPPKSKTNGSKSTPKSKCETLATQGFFPFQMAMKIPHPQTHPTIIECYLHFKCIMIINDT
jgi:hypothetical protein